MTSTSSTLNTTSSAASLPIGSSHSSLSTSSSNLSTKSTKHTTSYGSGKSAVVRRQSVVHARNASLVSSSPFKLASSVTNVANQPSKQRPPARYRAPSRTNQSRASRRSVSGEHKNNTKSDENKPLDSRVTRRTARQSNGFQNLSHAENVSRSPFLDGNRANTTAISAHELLADSQETIVKSPDLSQDIEVDVPTSTKPSPAPSPRQLPPTPITPPVPARVLSLATQSNSPSRSNLVSKRLHGPRSPSCSPCSDGPRRRSRRKTVTFDERCDVLEFDQDDPTEVLSDSEDPLLEPSQPLVFDWNIPGIPMANDNNVPVTGMDIDQSDVTEVIEQDSYREASIRDQGEMMFGECMELDPTDQYNLQETHENPLPPIPEDQSLSMNRSEDFSKQLTSVEGLPTALYVEPSISLQTVDDGPKSAHCRPRRITRDAILRQMEQHHEHLPQEFIAASDHAMDETTDGEYLTNAYVPSFGAKKQGAVELPLPSPSFDLNQPGVDLDDVRSALDKLMHGVEIGFDTSLTSSNDGADAAGDVEMVHHSRVLDATFASPSPDDTLSPPLPMLRNSTSISATGTETTDEGPITPQLDDDMYPPKPDLQSKPLPQRPDSPPKLDVAFTPTRPSDSVLLQPEDMIFLSAPSLSRAPVRRGTIKKHEEVIKAKRREQRAAEGRPTRRRSLSTGDVDSIRSGATTATATRDANRDALLDVSLEGEVGFSDTLGVELAKVGPNKRRTYLLREQQDVIYADDKVSHIGRVGDVDSGKAWRAVRRPSDMNEYSQEIKQSLSHQAGKAHGKVFVKVIGIRAMDIPMPQQATYFTCVLNNGIHFVETPVCKLGKEARVEQEFELIEHEKLEFTLTIKVRKDSHITALLNPSPTIPIPAPIRTHTPTNSKGGMRNFFGSPKKPGKKERKEKEREREMEPVLVPEIVFDPFVKHLRKDMSIARAFVAFKDIAPRCDTKLFETSYPLIGQVVDDRNAGGAGNGLVTRPVGEIVLQVFRLPPIPGVAPNLLPQSLEECHRGLRHVHWHKVIYYEGVLTQLGGDCTTWRRRHLRVKGANLIAYNDVTKKAISKIDLRKVIGVEEELSALSTPPDASDASDGQAGKKDILQVPRVIRKKTSFNALQGIEHSFRLLFNAPENGTHGDDEIAFFADSEEEKKKWLEILGALIGRIPPNPLWAEVLWQQQQSSRLAA